MTILTTLLMFATVPMDRHILREQVECLEINTVYDGEGNVTFRQAIGWDWTRGRHHVAGWMTMTDKTWRKPKVFWMEGNQAFELRGKYWRETHSQYDPGLAEREILHQCHRRGLAGGKR